MTVANRLAEFVVKTRFEDLPRYVIKQAKRHILDFIGVALAGSRTKISKTLTALLKEFRNTGESTVIGDGAKIPAVDAALVNGAIGHVLELDDGHRFANAHPGTVVIPSALATAEQKAASGKDFIVAVVLGYEVMIRIASALNPSHLRRGFHTTGTCGTFGAAVASSKIFGLNIQQVSNALGIAGVQASGLLVALEEPEIKPLQAGKAAQSGVYAALLAEKGIRGPQRIFESDMGFIKATSNEYALDQIIENLGKNYEIMRGYIKLHAACRHTHTVLDAALENIKRNKIDVKEIQKIIVRTYSIGVNLTGRILEPKSVEEAKFSIPYVLAVGIIEGKAGIHQFSDEKLKDPRILTLIKKIEVFADPSLDKEYPMIRPAVVSIFIKSGEGFTHRVDLPKGEPEFPVTDREVRSKFMDLATTVLSTNRAAKIIRLVNDLENVENVSKLTRCLY